MTGIWTSIPALPAGETWIHHVLVRHPGLVAFLVMDAVVVVATTTLTVTQASMVIVLPANFLLSVIIEVLVCNILGKISKNNH
jgi:hypothetical protein